MGHEPCFFGIYQLIQKPYLLDLQPMDMSQACWEETRNVWNSFMYSPSPEGWMLHPSHEL
jgi:hypothetical protein